MTYKQFSIKILFIVFFTSYGAFAQQDSTKSEAFALPNGTDLFLKGNNKAQIKQFEKLIAVPAHQLFIEGFNKQFGQCFNKKSRYDSLQIVNVDEWEMKLFAERKHQLDFLKNYPQKTALSDNFQTLVQANINYNYWHYLLAYSIIRSNKNTKLTRVVSLPKIMTDELIPEKVDNENLMVLETYRDFLPFFVTYWNSQANKFEKYADQVKSITDKATTAQKYLKGKTQDYTLAKLIYDNHVNLTASSAKFWISQIDDADYQKELLSHCAETLNKKEVVAKKEDKTKGEGSDFVNLSGEKFGFENYKGKVLYVDFWASWCGPCRQQFPFSKQMHEKLSKKQQKQIIFLYISIDDDQETWKKAIEKLQLNNGEHGISMGGWASDAVKKFGINSIPRYMIVDKTGKLVDPNAPRPSDPELLNKLIKLSE